MQHPNAGRDPFNKKQNKKNIVMGPFNRKNDVYIKESCVLSGPVLILYDKKVCK